MGDVVLITGHDARFGEDDEHQPIARLAMAHYQFETLHPFADGNGILTIADAERPVDGLENARTPVHLVVTTVAVRFKLAEFNKHLDSVAVGLVGTPIA